MSDDKSTEEQQGTDAEDTHGDEHESDKDTGGEGEQVRDPEAVAAKNKELLGELKAARSKLSEFEKAAEERRQAEMTETEKAIEAAEKAGYERAAAELGKALLRERVIARASGVFQDPTDAVALLDLDSIDLEDEDAVDAALKALIESKPHLRARKGGRDVDQGPRGDGRAGTDSPNDWLRGVIGR